jgi:single-stranded-DNA-specific exonuclease
MTSSDAWAYSPKSKERVPVRLPADLDPGPTTHSPLIARLLRLRGITEEEAPRFLHPAPSDLTPPSAWPSASRAARALAGAVRAGRARHLHGDYDADGLTSTAVLAACLQRAGARVTWTIPNRPRDGYGLGPRAVEAAREAGAGMLVALDCGTNNAAVLASAIKAGMEAVVLDHHIPRVPLPEGVVLANPHGEDCPAAFRDFPTAGIAFEVALETASLLGRPEDPLSLARVACLGIVQDVAPLTGENRIIVKLGMAALPTSRSPFLKGLLKAAGAQDGPVRTHHLSYRIGPRLNAPGRMDDAAFVVDLLLGRDVEAVRIGLLRIEEFNRRRQEEQETTLREAMEQIDPKAPVLGAAGDGWPLGVVGLVAGKLAQEHGRPALVFSRRDGLARGSGRSVPGLSLAEVLQPHAALFRSFGGHDSACGLTVDLDRWDDALAAIRGAFAAVAAPGPPPLEAEARVSFKDLLDAATLRDLDALEPFGPGNPRPVLLARGVEAPQNPEPIYRRRDGADAGGGQRRPCGWRLRLMQGAVELRASWFGDAPPPAEKRGSPLFTVDQWRGRAQLDLLGFLEDA